MKILPTPPQPHARLQASRQHQPLFSAVKGMGDRFSLRFGETPSSESFEVDLSHPVFTQLGLTPSLLVIKDDAPGEADIDVFMNVMDEIDDFLDWHSDDEYAIGDADYILIVRDQTEKIVGVEGLTLLDDEGEQEDYEKHYVLKKLHVEKTLRHQGVGTALAEIALKVAKARGITHLYTAVNSKGVSSRRSLGFQEFDEHSTNVLLGAFRKLKMIYDPDGKHKAHFMYKQL